MIDPIQSLSFAIQANPGVYALLLGSGISKAAGIPTGWEVVLNLLGKLAQSEEESITPEKLEEWYRKKAGKDPSYSDILAAVAKTPPERQLLLRSYWEATDEERTEGDKQPTRAHHAIADLVQQGFVKVIITTNFDRLMERALEQRNIVPTVLSTKEQVEGAIPLVHLQRCVFKVHGDYLDPHILNTPDELAQYPCAINQLLDRIFDEYGLVVCGWSAEWDTALQNAIYRCQSRRFTTYWAARGEPSDTACRLIEHRQAELISIGDADSFFQDVRDHVMSIKEFSTVHPLSVEVSIARMKRYLPEERHRIQLSDLIDHTVDHLLDQTTGDAFDTRTSMALNSSQLTERVRSYTMASCTLMELAVLGGYWIKESQLALWEKALDRLLSRGPSVTGGTTTVINLHRLPGILLLYALGLGAVAARHFGCLNSLFQAKMNLSDPITGYSGSALWALFANQQDIAWETLESDGITQVTPFNDFVHGALRPSITRLGLDHQQYVPVFNRLELLMAMGMYHRDENHMRGPWQVRCLTRDQNWNHILNEIETSISELKAKSPYVTCGILGNTASNCFYVVKDYRDYAMAVHRQRF